MTGTTIAATGTIGILITLASENPVTITPKGTIITTGYYALEDTVVPGNSDQILNQGKLSGQSGIIVSGASATVTDLGSIAGTNAYGVDALENASVEVGNIDNTTASLAGLEYGAAFGGATTAASNVTNFATIVGGTAIEDLNAGQLNVTNEATSAQIRATSGDAVLSNGALDLTNNGSIAGAIQANGGGTVLNGNLSALLVPVVTSASITGNIGMSGTKDVLLNFGKVIGGAFLNAGTILNGSSFDITALLSNANNYGASISQPGTVINYGTIAGRAAGVALGDGGTVTNGSTSDTVALISGGAGIAGSSANAVYNYATVTGGVGTSGGITITVVNGSSADTKATVTGGIVAPRIGIVSNFGAISSATYAISLGTGMITNGSNADTAASITGASAVSIGGGSVANFGAIVSTSGAGISISSSGSVRNGSATDRNAVIKGSGIGVSINTGFVSNFGTIIGGGVAVEIGQVTPGGTLVNSGTIVGSAAFDAVQMVGGTIDNTGTIQSAATSVAIVANAVSLLDEAAGSVLTGSISGAIGTVVNDSTISITGGFDGLHVTGDVDPSSSGVFQLVNNGHLDIAAATGNNLKIQFMGHDPLTYGDVPSNGLVIDNPSQFGQNVGSLSYKGPLLEGFAQGDAIDLSADALQRAFESARTVGSSMVIVDALDEAAAGFYAAHGFVRLPDSLRLVLPMRLAAISPEP